MSATGRRVLFGLILGAATLVAAAGLLRISNPPSNAAIGAASQATESTTQRNASPPTEKASPGRTTGGPKEQAVGETEPESLDRTDSTLDLSDIRSLSPATEIPKLPTPTPVPIAVRIAEIGITDGTVVPVGVEDNGEYEVPQVTDVGWYKFGPAPGDDGSTVLAAHVAYDGNPGVFQYLATAEPGAVVEIVMSDATTVSYEIDRVVDYLKKDLPTESLFDESGPDRLVLITCGGAFNPALRSYGSNTVAYATRLD